MILQPLVDFQQLPEASTSTLEDAYNRGFEEGQREARASFVHELGEQTAAAELKLDRARQAWAEDAGAVLSRELSTAVQEMHHTLADSFSDVLLPIVGDEVRQGAVRKIATAIKSTVPGDWQGPLRVEGPADLVTSLRNSLGEMASMVECHEVPEADMIVAVNDTVLKTQLTAWSETVKRMLS